MNKILEKIYFSLVSDGFRGCVFETEEIHELYDEIFEKYFSVMSLEDCNDATEVFGSYTSYVTMNAFEVGFNTAVQLLMEK